VPQPFGFVELEAAQEGGIDDGKAHGVGADAKRHGDHRSGGEPLVADDEPRRESQVLQQVLDDRQSARVAMLQRQRRWRANLDPGGAPCVGGRHAARDVVRGQHLDVCVQLVREVLVGA
jgi:hypothetical protein